VDAGGSATGEGHLRVGDATIQVLKEKDPAKLPWRALGVDVVLEATGCSPSATGRAAPGRRRAQRAGLGTRKGGT